MISGTCTSPFYYGFMCDESFFYAKLHLTFVYSSCLFALYVTMRKSKEFGSLWLNAVAYILAGYSTCPGLLHLGYKMKAD